MKLVRTSLLGLFLSATSASHAVEKMPVIETIEDQAISAMVSRNIKSFLVMNEKTGTLTFIRDGKVYLTSPAISGSVKGDDVTKDASVTRSGIFILQHNPIKNSFEYFRHGSDVYLVHPSAGAVRKKLFNSHDPEKLRASGGCISLPPQTFDTLTKLTDQNTKDPDFLIILPEEENIASFIQRHFPQTGGIRPTIY